MRFTRTHIEAFGYEFAPEVVTSEEIEERLAPCYRALKIQPGQLVALTGIRERRFWEPGFPPSQGAARAAHKALLSSKIPSHAIETLIYAGVCRDHFEPATACHVAAHLLERGIAISPHAAIYDISNACLGVLNGMADIAHRIELGQIRAGMVVSCESARDIVEIAIAQLLTQCDMERFSKSIATMTGGSGAVALILSDGSFSEITRPRLISSVTRAAPQHHLLCRWGIQHNPHSSTMEPVTFSQFMTTDPVAVLKHGVQLGIETWAALMHETSWRTEEVDRMISHQVGAEHRRIILQSLHIDEARDFVTYEYLGNTGTVALPLTMALAAERGFLQTGHRVALAGIGSGLNCMMLGVEW